MGRDEDMELTGVLKNLKVDFQGLIKNNVEFPGIIKKIMRNFQESWF